MKKICIILSIIFFVLGCLSGFGITTFLTHKKETKTVVCQDRYAEGWKAAEKRLIDTGTIEEYSQDFPIKSVEGKITSVGGNKLGVKIKPVMPLDDPSLDNREITVDSNTKIIKYTKKSKELLTKEQEEFKKNAKPDMTEEEYMKIVPTETIKSEVTMNELTVGESVFITSAQDIKNTKDFTASEIIIQAY